MAVWQFNIYFIPRQVLLEKYGQVPTRIDFEDALNIQWWLPLQLDIGIVTPFLRMFGEVQEWTLRTEGLRCFGDTAANDISVSFDINANILEELHCRLDLRKIDRQMVDIVVSIATQFDCVLMDCRGRLFQPSLVALAESIKSSDAQRWVNDPSKYLDDISKGV